MLFHQMQLMVCAVIAKRRAREVLPEAVPGSVGGCEEADRERGVRVGS